MTVIKRPLFPYIVLSLLIIGFGIGIVKLFGTTVSSKFNEANSQAAAQVTFGEPSGHPWPRADVRQQAAPHHNDTRFDATSTFAIDVDTGSYTLARGSIEGGWAPDPATVRVEEFVNYFSYNYALPAASKVARVHFEGAPNPMSSKDRTYLLRIGLQAGGVGTRPPAHLTFLVDVSGSMSGQDRLPVAKEAIKTTVKQLGPRDRVAIVTYSGNTEVVLESTPATRRQHIFAKVDSLAPGGGTAMGSGMQLAYGIASRHAGPGRISRVIVMSDGDANIGTTNSTDMLADIRSGVDEGVTMSTVGFGTGNYQDAMMEQLADAGNGNYTYIDSADEVPRVFDERLESLLHVVAKDVKVQVEFDADAVESWRQIGYENRQLADRDFRNDRVDAGEMGAGHQVTALYEVKLARGVAPTAPIAIARFRHKTPHGHRAKEHTTRFTVGSLQKRLGESSNDLRFQSAVAAFAMLLRGDGGEVNLDWIEEIAASAHEGRPERLRFVELIRRTKKLGHDRTSGLTF